MTILPMTDIFDKCRSFTIARQLIESGIYPYFKELESEQAPEVTIQGKKFIMFGSNNYLGLANDPRMKQAAIDAVKKYGTGVAGSRFLNGNTVLHTDLEKKLAAFKGREAALIYATGYQMNLGVVSALVGKGDFAVVDKLDHASILDGCRLSHGEVRRFKHNNPADLDRVLKDIGPGHGKLVIVDGVFSMEGDISPVPEISKVCKKHGARLMVDDAHATGVLGKHGHGTMEHFGLTSKDVDLVVGTCSKSFASVGGFVVGDEDIIHYIQHVSRSMIFSAALPPSSVASIAKAIDIIQEEPQRIRKLWDNSAYLMKRFKALGLNTGETATPIIPVIIGDNEKTFMLWRMLYDNGLFTNPVVSPAVPPKRSLLRVVVTATHTREQLDNALDIFEGCVRKVIKTRPAHAAK
ncbi:MAG: pyridoxal phosphate-dependent aminotransferase family protein [Elusimicrobia bacterium]|nr:pyridoxal phosphate-dependent aminotransferase family protein [Elusimicrobiota bacterium]